MVGMVLPLLNLKEEATMLAFELRCLVERKSGERMVGKRRREKEKEMGCDRGELNSPRGGESKQRIISPRVRVVTGYAVIHTLFPHSGQVGPSISIKRSINGRLPVYNNPFHVHLLHRA
jgi:hypothetical protein